MSHGVCVEENLLWSLIGLNGLFLCIFVYVLYRMKGMDMVLGCLHDMVHHLVEPYEDDEDGHFRTAMVITPDMVEQLGPVLDAIGNFQDKHGRWPTHAEVEAMELSMRGADDVDDEAWKRWEEGD